MYRTLLATCGSVDSGFHCYPCSFRKNNNLSSCPKRGEAVSPTTTTQPLCYIYPSGRKKMLDEILGQEDIPKAAGFAEERANLLGSETSHTATNARDNK